MNEQSIVVETSPEPPPERVNLAEDFRASGVAEILEELDRREADQAAHPRDGGAAAG
jgi:hypothetical protein